MGPRPKMHNTDIGNKARGKKWAGTTNRPCLLELTNDNKNAFCYDEVKLSKAPLSRKNMGAGIYVMRP